MGRHLSKAGNQYCSPAIRGYQSWADTRMWSKGVHSLGLTVCSFMLRQPDGNSCHPMSHPAFLWIFGLFWLMFRLLYWQAWLNKREPQEHDVLEQLFECVFDEVYTYVKQNLNPKMEVLECNVITQVCCLLSFWCAFSLAILQSGSRADGLWNGCSFGTCNMSRVTSP